MLSFPTRIKRYGMQEKNVLLHIQGIQSEGSELSDVELFTDGLIMRWGTGWKLSYKESEISGMEGATTVIHAMPSKVTMHRKGEYGARMEFTRGLPFMGNYHTPYGELRLQLYPSVVRSTLDEEGLGEIELKYQLEIGDVSVGVNHLQIQVMDGR